MSEREEAHRGYLARNQDVAKCIGLNAGLCSIKKRMQQRKDCPLWILEKLDNMIFQSDCLLRPLVEHRDELPRTIKLRS